MADALANFRRRRQLRAAWQAENRPSHRSCDGCDVCCFALPIREMGKPAGVSCEHRCGEPGRSCEIYADRPRVCREFFCMWRMADHWLPDWLKPSECGFAISFNRLEQFPAVITVSVDPARPDAWRTLHAQTVLTALAEHLNCMVAIGFGANATHVISPAGNCYPATAHMRSTGQIGAPERDFGPDHRPLADRLQELRITWSLPAP